MRQFVLALLLATAAAQVKAPAVQTVPLEIELEILKAGDLRTYDDSLAAKLDHANPRVRERAALGAGRVGDPKAIPALADLATKDKDPNVRRMAVFGLGETEAEAAAEPLVAMLQDKDAGLRARAHEALGKIAAALPEAAEQTKERLGKSLVAALEKEKDVSVLLKALTAILRARPAEGGKASSALLSHTSANVRATALNTLARLQYKEAGASAEKLLADQDAIVRANAARVLANVQDAESLAALTKIATTDIDARVRVSALRALATRKQDTAESLLKHAEKLLSQAERNTKGAVRAVRNRPAELNELLTYATMFGQTAHSNRSSAVVAWLERLRKLVHYAAPEVEFPSRRSSHPPVTQPPHCKEPI